MRMGHVIGALALSATAAYAQDVAHCAAIGDPNDRLSCFDAEFLEAIETPTDGNWDISISRSQLDDSETVVMRVVSEEQIRGRYYGSDTATFILRCKENTTSAYIVWAGHFMADIQGHGRVDYRVDDRTASHRNMSVSTDNMALGLWRGNQSIPFIEEIMDGNRLYARATPFSESAIEATFSISGMGKVIAPLRAACNW